MHKMICNLKRKNSKKTLTWKLFGNFISETRTWTVFEFLAIYWDKVKCHWKNNKKNFKNNVPGC